MDGVEGWSIVDILQRSVEEPGWEHLEVDVSSLVEDVKPDVVKDEMQDAAVSHIVADGGRNGEENGVGKTLSDLEGESGGGLGIDRLVMVGVVVLVEPRDVESTMPPVVDELDNSGVDDQMPGDSRPEELLSEEGHVTEELHGDVEESDGDGVEDESDWPDALSLVLLLVDKGSLGDSVGLSVLGSSNGHQDLEDDGTDEHQKNDISHGAVEVREVKIGEILGQS